MQIRRLEDFDRLHQETLIREGSNRFPTEYTLNGITYDVSGMSRVQKVSLASLMNICGAELSVLHSLVMRANDADNSRMSLPKDSVNRKELERELLGAGIISMHYCLFVLERQLKIIAELDAIIAGRHDKHKTPRIHDVNRLWRSIRPHQTAFLEELNKLNPYHQFSKDKLDSWFDILSVQYDRLRYQTPGEPAIIDFVNTYNMAAASYSVTNQIIMGNCPVLSK